MRKWSWALRRNTSYLCESFGVTCKVESNDTAKAFKCVLWNNFDWSYGMLHIHSIFKHFLSLYVKWRISLCFICFNSLFPLLVNEHKVIENLFGWSKWMTTLYSVDSFHYFVLGFIWSSLALNLFFKKRCRLHTLKKKATTYLKEESKNVCRKNRPGTTKLTFCNGVHSTVPNFDHTSIVQSCLC